MLSARQKPNKLKVIARKRDLKITYCVCGGGGGGGGRLYPYKTEPNRQIMNNRSFHSYCHSTYSPTNSAASPECLKTYSVPSLMHGHCYCYCCVWGGGGRLYPYKTEPDRQIMNNRSFSYSYCTLITALITLLLPWMPDKWSNSISYGRCYSTYGPTNSAALPECLKKVPNTLMATDTLLMALLTLLVPLNAWQMIKFLLLRPLLLYLRLC